MEILQWWYMITEISQLNNVKYTHVHVYCISKLRNRFTKQNTHVY